MSDAKIKKIFDISKEFLKKMASFTASHNLYNYKFNPRQE
jgi:hypothetical protein